MKVQRITEQNRYFLNMIRVQNGNRRSFVFVATGEYFPSAPETA